MEDVRELKVRLRNALVRYRGGRFETGDSGGAGGMMFFVDRDGKQWYIGGMAKDHAEAVTAALNLVLRLLR
ncbi:MAG TPA: hypothetical protein VGR02_18755 [Thermoanaerobaculia bacterium]|jgi:hypothetical protein|nr:hypothetical protein [Thermoanaerobaculia bacterium]